MRARSCSVLFVAFVGALVATTPGTSACSSDDRACGEEMAPSCARAREIGSRDALLAELRNLGYQPVGNAISSRIGVSDDLLATADLEIDAADLPPGCAPSGQPQNPLCQPAVLREHSFVRLAKSVDGTSCLAPAPLLHASDGCSKLHIAKGTTFRLRGVLSVTFATPSIPYMEIERPCTTPCDADESRCAATQTCLGDGWQTCTYCEAGEPARCACRDRCGDSPDDTKCEYDTSADTGDIGTCQGGVCRPAR